MRRRAASCADATFASGAEEPHNMGNPKDDRGPPLQRRSCCCRALLVLIGLLMLTSFVALAMHRGSPAAVSDTLNFALMRFFRDLSRVKARRRRFGQKGALMPVLTGREEPLPLADATMGIGLTIDELAEYDGRPLPGSTERAPLFLAIHGRIYDVTAGAAFYGPGRKYHKLVGKDATRAFCTGCLEPDCLISSTAGLADTQLREAHRWIELYEHHDKYKLVGAVRQPSAAELSDLPAEEEAEAVETAAAESEVEWERELVERATVAEQSKKHKPFRPR